MSPPLKKGTLIKRYKRFFADIRTRDGEVITAHCPNTGSLKGCKEEGFDAFYSLSDNPKRKLKYTWEMVRAEGNLVGVNTGLANHLAEEALRAGLVPGCESFGSLRREVKYGKENSRIDILLETGNEPQVFVEVKNVTLAEGDGALFPDAVTERGRKHLREMEDMVHQGHRAVLLFCVQRQGVTWAGPADHIDPAYGKQLRQAAEAGVEIVALQADLSHREIRLARTLPVRL